MASDHDLQRDLIQRYDRGAALLEGSGYLFMNHGYASVRGSNAVPWLGWRDRRHRYHAQLLHQFLKRRGVGSKDVLEVGSGRGGNCVLLARYHEPRSVTGIDLSLGNVRFCRRTHRAEKIRFVHGSADDLPFADASFDVVFNVESSHCYPSLLSFYREVWRVLRPGGTFFYTDCMLPERAEPIVRGLRYVGFEVCEARDIRRNVAHALRVNAANVRRTMTGAASTAEGKRLAAEVWKGIDEGVYARYASGESAYHLWILEKPVAKRPARSPRRVRAARRR